MQHLSPRQVQVLQLRADGVTHKELPQALGVASIATADDHLAAARKKLGARTTHHAVALALRYRIIR